MEIEKYSPKRINQDTDPRAIHRSGDRVFLPGDILDAFNVRYLSPESRSLMKGIRGNILRFNELLGDGATTIGATVDEKNNRLIIFTTSEVSDKVFSWDPVTNEFNIKMDGDANFSVDHPITAWCIDGNIIWNDGLNPPRKIAENQEISEVGPIDDFQYSLDAYAPSGNITVSRFTNNAKPYNYVTNLNLQFAARIIYIDNTFSPLSTFSKVIPGKPHHDPTSSVDNGIVVLVPTSNARNAVTKAVEFCFREQGGEWKCFETKFPTFATLAHSAIFYNDGKAVPLSVGDQTNLFNTIPTKTPAMVVATNRVFVPTDRVGFNVDESTWSLAATPDVVDASGLDFANDNITRDNRYIKDGAIIGIGLVFFNRYDKPSFVRGEKYVRFPVKESREDNVADIYKYGCQSEEKAVLNWQLTGTPPEGMTKYGIVVTREQNYDYYAQCLAFPFRYIREINADESDNCYYDAGTKRKSRFAWRGKEFDRMYREADERSLTTSIYLQVPQNLPVVPQVGDIVRITSPTWGLVNDRFPIQAVYGDLIDIGMVNILNETNFELNSALGGDNINNSTLFIEVFREKTVLDENFYEIGQLYNIVDGDFSTTSGVYRGSTHTIIFNQASSDQFKLNYDYVPRLPLKGSTVTGSDDFFVKITDSIAVESPTSIIEGVVGLVTIGGSAPISVRDGFKLGEIVDKNIAKKIFTLNYLKPDGDFGRPHIPNVYEREVNLTTEISYSDPYVQGTDYNGISTFPAANKYVLPVESTPVRSMVLAGDNILAIHERRSSSLYLGRGVLKAGNEFITSRVEGVIGDDNRMMAKNGTINPESVQEIDGRVYWWDALNGAVCRWTNAGVYEISRNGMFNYFRNKGKQYYQYRNSVKIITGYDKDHDELIITFPEIPGVPAVTWSFNITEEVWTHRYAFVPELYATINLDFVSFLNGQLWHHNKSEVYNNFYGVQYGRSWRPAINPMPGKMKTLLNVHIQGLIAEDPSSSDVVVRIFTPEGQESYIPAYEFEQAFGDRGVWRAPVLKDINSIVEAGKLALRSGRDMMSDYFEIEIINNRSDEAPSSHINVAFKTDEFSR